MRLRVEGITKKYGKKTALNKVDFFADNGVYGLLGPNGSGKTTLMRIIAGIIRPDAGNVYFDNKDIMKNIEAFRYELGYLPQEFGCFKSLKVKECLETIGILKGLTQTTERQKQIENILMEVNLDKHSDKKVGALSGGMRRRLGIAQSMLGNPSIIIVDEPTSGLDPEERIRFRTLIRKIASNRVVLLSTHIIEDIKNICDGIALIKNGQIEQFDELGKLEAMAANKVWQLVINPDDYPIYSTKYKVLSTNKLFDRLELRIYSASKPGVDAIELKPGIEEGYLSWVEEKR